MRIAGIEDGGRTQCSWPLPRARLASTLMGIIPDPIMDAIHLAESIMAREKNDRVGSTADTV